MAHQPPPALAAAEGTCSPDHCGIHLRCQSRRRGQQYVLATELAAGPARNTRARRPMRRRICSQLSHTARTLHSTELIRRLRLPSIALVWAALVSYGPDCNNTLASGSTPVGFYTDLRQYSNAIFAWVDGRQIDWTPPASASSAGIGGLASR